jgi:hypothetical protein
MFHVSFVCTRATLPANIVQWLHGIMTLHQTHALGCECASRINPSTICCHRPLLPQPLQLPENHQIRVQKPVYTLPHARLFVFVQFGVLDVARGYAFSEAGIGEGVYR